MAKITAPVKSYDEHINGEKFTDGVLVTDNEAVIAYCTRRGYTVEHEEAPETGETEQVEDETSDSEVDETETEPKTRRKRA
jgi:hypothetical protein